MHDREPDKGSVQKVWVKREAKAKGGYIKAKSKQLSKSLFQTMTGWAAATPYCQERCAAARKTRLTSPKSRPQHDCGAHGEHRIVRRKCQAILRKLYPIVEAAAPLGRCNRSFVSREFGGRERECVTPRKLGQNWGRWPLAGSFRAALH